MKIKKYMYITCLILNLILIKFAAAQSPVTLEEAYKRAINTSQAAGFYSSVIQLAEAESKMGVSYPFLNTLVEGGQINSALVDTKITFSQSGYFPGYHKAFKNMQAGKLQLAIAEKQMGEWEIKRFLSSLYLQYSYYLKVSDIYSKQDSLFSLALDRAKERLSAGETDGIEVMEARAQLTHVKKMKMESLSELKGLITMFRLWIGGEGIPDVSSIAEQQWSSASEEAVVTGHPLLKKLDDGIQIAQMEGSWKKAQLNPMWTLALSNTSFRGTGADDKKYDVASRFTSVQLGVGMPVFGRQGKKLAEIAKMATQRAETEKTMNEARLRTMIAIQKEKWNTIQQQYADFEKESLPLASQLLTIARNKLESGEIDFMKYAYMTGQAYSLMLDHASLKKQLDEAGLEYYFVY